MKKIIVFCLALALLSVTASPAYCGMNLKKMVRGVSNMITCPLEIPNRVYKAYKRSGFCYAITFGIVEGCVMTGYRAVVGIDETVTFYVPASEGDEPIISDPEFFFGPSAKSNLTLQGKDESGAQTQSQADLQAQSVSNDAGQNLDTKPETDPSEEHVTEVKLP